MRTASSVGASSGPKATASPQSPACRAIRSSTTPAAPRAASRRRSTAACTGSRSSTTSPVQSIGSLAVAPSDPNVVWAGTGEAWIRSHISIGDGIYRSTDAGKTWTRMGLEKTGRIGRVVIDPSNPQIVLACALGTAYGPQPERGVFRTADGGTTWQRTLFVDETTGCSEIAMDPSNARILFAGMWQLETQDVGPRERRTRQRSLHVSRRRRDLAEADRTRAAGEAGRQGDAGHRALESQTHLHDDRNRRRHPLEGSGHRPRSNLAIRRRRRHVEDGERRPERDGPHGVLRPHGRRHRQRERDLLLECVVQQVDRRRRDAGDDEWPRGARRRPPRHVDRSGQRAIG